MFSLKYSLIDSNVHATSKNNQKAKNLNQKQINKMEEAKQELSKLERLMEGNSIIKNEMQLKCNSNLDSNTPDFLKNRAVEVSFTLDNYGEIWFLLV